MPHLDFQAMLSNAMSSVFVAGIQQASQLHPQLAPLPTLSHHSVRLTSPLHGDVCSEADSDQGEACPEYIEFSDDEGILPDLPSFTGLFKPSLFKALLHKARQTTNLGVPPELPSDPKTSARIPRLLVHTILYFPYLNRSKILYLVLHCFQM